MTRLLGGRTALVTGGSRGIGAGIAAALGRHGCAVAVNYLSRADDAERVAERIRAEGGRALTVGADAADEAQARAMVERIAVEMGDVDVLRSIVMIGSTSSRVSDSRRPSRSLWRKPPRTPWPVISRPISVARGSG